MQNVHFFPVSNENEYERRTLLRVFDVEQGKVKQRVYLC